MEFKPWYMNHFELGVRLAEMKRDYYRLTGNVVTSKPGSLQKAIEHLMKNQEKCSFDAQELAKILQIAKKQGLSKKLIKFLRDNVDKVVVNQKSTSIS